MTHSKAHSGPKNEKAILDVLSYFDFFTYAPNKKELHMFMGQRVSLKSFKAGVASLVKSKKISHSGERYALRGHSIYIDITAKRKKIAGDKVAIAESYANVLSIFPWILLVGLSGSCAMGNTQQEDDIDIFVISSVGSMWLARITAIIVAKLIGRHRHRNLQKTKDTVCLNLFFDGSDLHIPKKKRNLYTAHEVLQMKPLVSKKGTYEEFISTNRWVQGYFPNVKIKRSRGNGMPSGNVLFSLLNAMAKSIQMKLMKKPSREIITNTQLWFFPKDFEEKVKKHIKV